MERQWCCVLTKNFFVAGGSVIYYLIEGLGLGLGMFLVLAFNLNFWGFLSLGIFAVFHLFRLTPIGHYFFDFTHDNWVKGDVFVTGVEMFICGIIWFASLGLTANHAYDQSFLFTCTTCFMNLSFAINSFNSEWFLYLYFKMLTIFTPVSLAMYYINNTYFTVLLCINCSSLLFVLGVICDRYRSLQNMSDLIFVRLVVLVWQIAIFCADIYVLVWWPIDPNYPTQCYVRNVGLLCQATPGVLLLMAGIHYILTHLPCFCVRSMMDCCVDCQSCCRNNIDEAKRIAEINQAAIHQAFSEKEPLV